VRPPPLLRFAEQSDGGMVELILRESKDLKGAIKGRKEI